MQLPADGSELSSSAGGWGIGSLGGVAGDASRPGGSPSENGSGIGQFSGEIGPMRDGRGQEGGPVSIAETAVLERRRVPRYPVQKRKPAEVLRVIAKGVRAEFKSLQWACRQVRTGMLPRGGRDVRSEVEKLTVRDGAVERIV